MATRGAFGNGKRIPVRIPTDRVITRVEANKIAARMIQEGIPIPSEWLPRKDKTLAQTLENAREMMGDFEEEVEGWPIVDLEPEPK